MNSHERRPGVVLGAAVDRHRHGWVMVLEAREAVFPESPERGRGQQVSVWWLEGNGNALST